MDFKRSIQAKECNKNNDNKIFNCISEFIISKIDCNLPWMKNNMKASRNCSNTEDMENFFDVQIGIYKGQLETDLEDFGCLPKNCEMDWWVAETMTYFQSDVIQSNELFANYNYPNKTTFWFNQLSAEV